MGKGVYGRLHRLERAQSTNKHTNIARKHGLNRSIEFETYDERAALDKEIELIAQYKLYYYDNRDNQFACNFTIGGDGSTGYSFTAEQRCNCSIAQRIAQNDPVHKARRLAQNALPEVKARKSVAQRAARARDEDVRKRAATNERPDVKARRSAGSIRAMARPGTREAISASLKEANRRDDVRRNRSRGSLNSWRDETARENRLRAMRNPETIARRLAKVEVTNRTDVTKHRRKVANMKPETLLVIDYIAQLYQRKQSGERNDDLAREWGVHKQTMYKLLRQFREKGRQSFDIVYLKDERG